MLWYVVIKCGWVLFRFSTHTINKKTRISPIYHQPVPQIWVSAYIVWVHHIEKPSPSGWNEMVSIQREISTYIHKAIVDGLSCLLFTCQQAILKGLFVAFPSHAHAAASQAEPPTQHRAVWGVCGWASSFQVPSPTRNHHIKKENNQTQINIRDCQIAFNIWKIDMVGHHCNNPEFLKYLHQSLDLCSTCHGSASSRMGQKNMHGCHHGS